MRVTISKRLHADAESINGSERSIMVNRPAAKRGFGGDDLFVRLAMNDLSRDIRCSSPASCAGLKLRFSSSSLSVKALKVKSSPRSRNID